MRFKFPTLILTLAFVAAAALAINPAHATTTTLHVPFDFTVNGQYLPAGLYTVQRDNFGNFLRLLGKDSSESFTWVARQASTQTDKIVLRFDEEGQSHTLQSVQFGKLMTPRLDKKPKSGKSVIQEISPMQ